MNTVQYRIFAWIYSLAETVLAGAATAFLTSVGDAYQGQPFEIRRYLMNAGIAAIVAGSMYLKRSPLPELLQIKKEVPDGTQ